MKLPKGTRYDKEKADNAVNFINGLCHVHGEWAGKPFNLMKWQEKIVRDIFGTVKADGNRQYNTAFIFTPKKNAKSELAAAVALYLLCADGEYGAEIYGCAADKNQAGIIFKTASQMVRLKPALAKRIKVNDATKRLVYPMMNSFYQVMSADVPSKHGINAHGVIFDELLAQPNRELYDVMTKGAGDARRQPLTFVLSTAGTDKRSICYEVYQKARDVLAGRRIDPTFYPVIYGAEPTDDWESEETWKRANPSLGVSITADKLRQAYESAKGNPVEEKLFRQLRLNIWSEDTARWLPIETWHELAEGYDEYDLRGKACYGGLDLSNTTDITAFVLIFPPDEQRDVVSNTASPQDNRYRILPYFWIPEANMEKRIKRDHVRYDAWQTNGYIMTTEGSVVHYEAVENFIKDLGERFEIRQIAMDRWNGTATAQRLERAGFTMIEFGQGFRSMTYPTKELMRLILDKKISHNGNDALDWMLENMVVKTDEAGNVKPDKVKSAEKIDGAVALIMALDIALKGGGEPTGSVYDHRDLLII
jgi:phage terminase large subunit-like protein